MEQKPKTRYRRWAGRLLRRGGSLKRFRFAAAFAVTTTALVGGAPAYEIATASEFDAVFAPFELSPEAPVLSEAELVQAELRSDSAPREAEEQAIRGGHASYYGARFAGRLTASGETFNPRQLTAAHRSLPFGSKVRVTNQRNGKSVVVRINDRGPFAKGRVIDLSKAAAQRIGLVKAGHGPVELALLD